MKRLLLAIAALLACGRAAEAATVKLEYTVDDRLLRAAITGTTLTFELHSDSTCTSLVDVGFDVIDNVFVERLKRFKPIGGAKVPNTARLVHVLSGVTAPSTLFVRVTGVGIAPIGGACQAQYASVGANLPCATQIGSDVFFTACNVHVRNGGGGTASTNGLGNLIVGYNESSGDTRTGSHNLVVGRLHSYSSYGGLLAGENNAVSNAAASVVGGNNNTASGSASFVGGGFMNSATGLRTSVTGGSGNVADALHATVAGGANNVAGTSAPPAVGLAAGEAPAVFGGTDNRANNTIATVCGGTDNLASGVSATALGGFTNTASGTQATVSGGGTNTASAQMASVSGGYGNTASALRASVSGGESNVASGQSSSVAGGISNSVSALNASIGGGTSVIVGAGGVNEWHAGRTAGYPVASFY